MAVTDLWKKRDGGVAVRKAVGPNVAWPGGGCQRFMGPAQGLVKVVKGQGEKNGQPLWRSKDLGSRRARRGATSCRIANYWRLDASHA